VVQEGVAVKSAALQNDCRDGAHHLEEAPPKDRANTHKFADWCFGALKSKRNWIPGSALLLETLSVAVLCDNFQSLF
jgi:hypothetical protein